MTAGGVSLPAVVGHRGAAAYAPENTIAGLRAAAERGARWVEFDARLAADGGLAVIHDATLDRTTDARGPVIRRTLAELARLDAGSWFGPAFRGEPIPSLEQALATAAELGLGVNIELKGEPARAQDTAAAAVRAVVSAWPRTASPPLISSFERAHLEAVRRVAPHLPRGMLAIRLRRGWLQRARALGAASIHVGEATLGRATVAAVKAAGWPLAVFTVNDPDRARALYAWGVDALFSDAPDVIAAVR